MKKFRRAAGRQGRPLARRRAWALATGMTLLLTSGFSVEAHAASAPEHNHAINFLPQADAVIGSWSAQADLYDRNGNLVYHWQTGSISGVKKTVFWSYYSEDPEAWLHLWARTGNGNVYAFLHVSGNCSHIVSFNQYGGDHDQYC